MMLDLFDATKLNKDGEVLCAHFEELINNVQKNYDCTVVYFLTNADGGSLKG
jgi:hypothetical protein